MNVLAKLGITSTLFDLKKLININIDKKAIIPKFKIQLRLSGR
ncbi:hypothetical protein UT300012_27820 [Paraclostridium bifermentans]